jgi:hypothetical protein
MLSAVSESTLQHTLMSHTDEANTEYEQMLNDVIVLRKK